ncbi:hypothetical protein KIN20_003642 [Parelaphostrongylus tenuis]|uniref:Globin family profile domain-containing protein n=1 Tax=Parelaphostrongylus tenuis TaxID=148309 RepID=A0AAD5M0I1_PARTN|nr:hypothetical protein KIN20_003642 [Parelaphostrongylus tenuis]
MGLCSSKKKPTQELTDEEVTAIREVWIRAKNNNVGKKILQTLIEKRPKFAEYFGIQSESLDIKALNQSKEFHLQRDRRIPLLELLRKLRRDRRLPDRRFRYLLRRRDDGERLLGSECMLAQRM